jgi:aspartate dehydrogenase
MRKDLGIGIIGCGSMGAELARSIGPGGIEGARVVATLDQSEERGRALVDSLPGHPAWHSDVDKFLATPDMEIVVECASQAAVKALGKAVMESGKTLLLMSSGALMDPELFEALSKAGARTGGRIVVPSGAVGGIDAIKAVRSDIEEVTIISTKKPESLSGAPGFAEWEGKKITGPVTVFEGPALEAVKLFPANVNVAATVSLAGIGPKRTIARVVADPGAPGNMHEIHVKGSFGEFWFKLINRPHPQNPKTSHLAVLAAIEALRALVDTRLRVGT